MNFVKYPSITNHYHQDFIEKIERNEVIKDLWYVQEKVHGANFAFYSDGKIIKCASRNGFIEDSEDFYNHISVLTLYKDNILELAKQFEGTTIVYGELCGGFYGGYSKGVRVQRGIQYHQRNEFIAFDIQASNGEFHDFDALVNLCKKYYIPVAPVLLSGTLKECLNHSHDFITEVPRNFGLQPIDDNICEGIIIRPNKTTFIGDHRVMIKKKNKKFSEKDERPIKIDQGFPEELQYIVDEITPYLNINRVNSVVSKIGKVDIKDFQKILGLTIQDALEEAGEVAFKKLDPAYRKKVSREIQKATLPVIKKYFGLPV